MTTVAVLQRGFVSPKNGAAGLRSEKYSRVTCPGRVQRGEAERNESRDPAQYGLPAAIRRVAPRSRVSLRSPGTRACEVAARAKRTVGRHSRFTMSNSAVLFVPAAHVAAPGFCPRDRVHPRMEGWAERRQAHYFCCRVSETRLVRTQRGTARPMTRDARLSALHRGDFRPGAALPSPALPPDPCSELLAARSSCLAGGVPDLPSPRLRAAAAGRHSPLRLSGSSLEDAPP
jgi:hypothetical protein